MNSTALCLVGCADQYPWMALYGVASLAGIPPPWAWSLASLTAITMSCHEQYCSLFCGVCRPVPVDGAVRCGRPLPAVLATLGLGSLASLTAVIAAAGAAAMLSMRILHPRACDMGPTLSVRGPQGARHYTFRLPLVTYYVSHP